MKRFDRQPLRGHGFEQKNLVGTSHLIALNAYRDFFRRSTEAIPRYSWRLLVLSVVYNRRMENRGHDMGIETRNLGTSGVAATVLGFGGATLGGVGDRVSESEADDVVHSAFAAGIRYFDTAPLYGHGLSEKRLGRTLAALPRDEFVLSTKVGRLLVSQDEGQRYAGMRDSEPFAIRYDYSYDAVRQSVESSLERLGLDRIDVLLCHDIDVWTHGDEQQTIFEVAANGALPALRDLREQGVIRAIGLGVNEWEVCVRVLDTMDVDCFLLAGRFTLLEQTPLDEMLPRCVAEEVSVIIGGPYNSGLLANADRRRATYDYKPAPDHLWDKAQRIREVCSGHSVDMRAAALQYPLLHPAVAAVIPGMRSKEEVQTNLRLMGVDIPSALWTELDDAGLVRGLSDVG
mgnify:FL=1